MAHSDWKSGALILRSALFCSDVLWSSWFWPFLLLYIGKYGIWNPSSELIGYMCPHRFFDFLGGWQMKGLWWPHVIVSYHSSSKLHFWILLISSALLAFCLCICAHWSYKKSTWFLSNPLDYFLRYQKYLELPAYILACWPPWYLGFKWHNCPCMISKESIKCTYCVFIFMVVVCGEFLGKEWCLYCKYFHLNQIGKNWLHKIYAFRTTAYQW